MANYDFPPPAYPFPSLSPDRAGLQGFFQGWFRFSLLIAVFLGFFIGFVWPGPVGWGSLGGKGRSGFSGAKRRGNEAPIRLNNIPFVLCKKNLLFPL